MQKESCPFLCVSKEYLPKCWTHSVLRRRVHISNFRLHWSNCTYLKARNETIIRAKVINMLWNRRSTRLPERTSNRFINKATKKTKKQNNNKTASTIIIALLTNEDEDKMTNKIKEENKDEERRTDKEEGGRWNWIINAFLLLNKLALVLAQKWGPLKRTRWVGGGWGRSGKFDKILFIHDPKYFCALVSHWHHFRLSPLLSTPAGLCNSLPW